VTKSSKIYFGLFFFFVIFGMVTVFNIKIFTVSDPETMGFKIVRGQILNVLVAAGGFLVAYVVNLEQLRDYWVKIGLVVIMLLLFATFFIGTEVNGAKRWINLGVFMLQPSEFAKIVSVFYMADVICNKRDRIGVFNEVIFPVGLIFFLVMTIAVEDLGTGIIIMATSMLLLFIGGMRLKYMAVVLPLAIIIVTILIRMEPYRIRRIEAWMDPWKYKQTIGYQQVQSDIAMGRGGLTGVGFGNSQRKLKYLPEASTDFIFSIIAEEFGFIGSLIMVGLFCSFFVMGIYFAFNRTNSFYFYVVSGFVLMLGMQTLINLGVVTSTLPNKGVPLPFISYGGSALLTYSMMVGFILNAVVQDRKSLYRL